MTTVFTAGGMIFRPEPIPNPIFSINRKRLVNDSMMGVRFVVDGSTSEGFSAEHLTFTYITIGRTEYFDMITWLDNMAGRRTAFSLPTWRHDFKLALDIGPSDASITIEKMGYNSIYEILLHRRLITIIAADQTMIHDRIIGSADLGATERLDFTAALGVTAIASETMVCLRPWVRLDKDNIEYSFIPESQIGTFNLSFIEVHPFESLALEPVYTIPTPTAALLDLLGDNDSVLPAITPSCLCPAIINTVIDLDIFSDAVETRLSNHVTDTRGDSWLVPTTEDNTWASGISSYTLNTAGVDKLRALDIGSGSDMCPRIDQIYGDDCLTVYADLSWSHTQQRRVILAMCLDELDRDSMTSDGIACVIKTVGNSTQVECKLERWDGNVSSIANNDLGNPDHITFPVRTHQAVDIFTPARYGIDIRGLVLTLWTADAPTGANRVDIGTLTFDNAFIVANRDGAHRKVGARPDASFSVTAFIQNFTVVQ